MTPPESITSQVNENPAEDLPEVPRQVESVLLELPIRELPAGHVTRHFELNRLSREEGEAICRLSAALDAGNYRLDSGKPVGPDRTKAVRWLLQQLVKQLAAVAVLLLLCCSLSAADAITHKRLSPDRHPVGTRVMFRQHDPVTKTWTPAHEPLVGDILEYSSGPGETLITDDGFEVPRRVRLSNKPEVMQPNPLLVGVLEPPVIGLTLLYFAGDRFLGKVQAEAHTHDARTEVAQRLAAGTLWTASLVTGKNDDRLAVLLESATTVVFNEWAWVTREESDRWEKVERFQGN